MTAKTFKTYRMKMRVRVADRDDAYVTVDVRASNAWDAEAAAERMVRRDYADAYAVYAVTKRRVAAGGVA